MGINNLKKLLKKRFPLLFEKSDMMRMDVVVEDLFSRIYRFSVKQYDIRGDEMYRRFAGPIHEFFANHRARLYVIAADKRRFVPHWKGDVHKIKRKRAIGRYDASCSFISDEGVWNTNTKTVDTIDIGELMRTRAMTGKLLTYLWYRLIRDSWPDHATIVMDFEVSPEQVQYQCADAKAWEMGPRVYAVHGDRGVYTEMKNSLGEGDLTAVWWVRRILAVRPQSSICVWTRDTDQIALQSYHLWNMDQSRVWFNGDLLKKSPNAKGDGLLHIGKLIRSLKRSGWSRQRFLGACILMGCDSNNVVPTLQEQKLPPGQAPPSLKFGNTGVRGCGPDAIFDGICRLRIADSDLNEHAFYMALVRATYAERYCRRKVHEKFKLDKKRTWSSSMQDSDLNKLRGTCAKYPEPSQVQVQQKQFTNISFRYWAHLGGAVKRMESLSNGVWKKWDFVNKN